MKRIGILQLGALYINSMYNINFLIHLYWTFYTKESAVRELH